jgi:hypothetical protein
VSETTTETPAPTKEAYADGARAIFDALTEKAREREAETARMETLKREDDAKAEEAKKARVRDSKGRFQIEVPLPKTEPKKAAVEQKAPAATNEHPEPKTDRQGRTEEPEADADATADDEKALTALRRAKVPKAVLDGMDRKERRRWGLELSEIQANTDRLTKEHRELKKQAEDKAKETKLETRSEAKQTATATADLEAAIKAFDEAGPEYGRALRDALAIQAKVADTKVSELNSAIELLRLEGLVANARTELRDVYPGLRKPDRYKAVIERMERLSKDPENYAQFTSPEERMTECMKDACESEFRADIEAEERSKAKETDRKRLGGQLSASHRATSASDLKGKDRSEQIYWLMAQENLTGAEARARVDGLR